MTYKRYNCRTYNISMSQRLKPIRYFSRRHIWENRAMKRDELFTEVGENSFGEPIMGLDIRRLQELRKTPLQNDDDLETAIMLLRFLHEEFKNYVTGSWKRLDDEEMEEAQRCLRGILRRYQVSFDLPWRNFVDAERYWHAQEGLNTPNKIFRQEHLDEIFTPPLDILYATLDRHDAAEVATPVSPRKETGWPAVDEAIENIRKSFASARSTPEYKAIGLHCVTAFERLSETVYDAQKHVPRGEDPIPKNQRKNRISKYIEASLPGKYNYELRALIRAADTLAETVKHRDLPTRRDAGIAADTVILVAHLLRRIDPSDSRQESQN